MAEVETAPVAVSTMFSDHPSTIAGQGSTPQADGDSDAPEVEVEGESSTITQKCQRQQLQPWGAVDGGPETMRTEERGCGGQVLQPTTCSELVGRNPRPEDDDDALSEPEDGPVLLVAAVVDGKPSRLPDQDGVVEPVPLKGEKEERGGEHSVQAGVTVNDATSCTNSSLSLLPRTSLPSPPEEEQAIAAVHVPSSTAGGPPEMSAPAPSGSRMICLRSLRNGGDGAGKAQAAVTTAAATARTGAASIVACAGSTVGVAGVVSNKVVDLREVKKVRPVVLTPIAAMVAPAAMVASAASSSDEEELAGGGSVKIDLSAGKRMIEFQLKVNAAEEKREAARVKSDRDRVDAAIAEDSQRALAQVNARIEAQRRGRGGSGGGGMIGFSSSSSSFFGSGDGVRAVAEAQIRALAERHGVRVHILDDEHSPEEQVRALAEEYGLRVKIIGEAWRGSGDGVHSDDSRRQEESTAGPQTGVVAAAAAATAAVMPKLAGLTPEVAVQTPRKTSTGASTPPPTLSSLRPRPRARSTSPSPAVRTCLKSTHLPQAPLRKTPSVPNPAPAKDGGGLFLGPARMMRMALSASSGWMTGEKEGMNRITEGAPSAFRKDLVEGRRGSAGEANRTPATAKWPKPSVVAVAAPAPAPTEGNVEGSVTTTLKPASDRRASPTLGLTIATETADSASGCSSRKSRDLGSGESTSSEVGHSSVSGRAAIESADVTPPSAATATVSETGSGRKRGPPSNSFAGNGVAGGGSGGGGGGGGRAVGQSPDKKGRNSVDGGVGGSGRQVMSVVERVGSVVGTAGVVSKSSAGARVGMARQAASKVTTGSLVTAKPVVRSSSVPPKRMRLVGPSGVVSQPNSPVSTQPRPGRRVANGGAAWAAGNNNLFKGAMAGIMGRGKRPSP